MSRRAPAVVLLLAGLLAGCTGAPAGGGVEQPIGRVEAPPTEPATVDPGRRGGSLRVALRGDPAAIDPARLTDRGGELVADALFDSLVALDDDLQPVPAAAADWEVSADGLRYTFRLREAATFHDGRPVTAKDFVRGLTHLVTGEGRRRSFAAPLLAPVVGFEAARGGDGGLAGVRALDTGTLRIRLRHRDGDFLTTLANPALAPLPPGAPADDDFGEQPVGNGPFLMDQPWEHGQFIRVQRFEDHDRPALLEEVVFQIYPADAGVAQQYEDFTEGNLDVAHAPPPVAAREDDPPAALDGPGVIAAPSLAIYFLGFDVTRPPFDDPALRRAVSLAIDRRALTADLLGGTRRPAVGIVPPGVPGARSEPCELCRHDPEAARTALARATLQGPVDEPVRLLHNSGRTHRAIAEEVATQLRTTLNLRVEVGARELSTYRAAVREGAADLFRSGWQPPVPSMDAVLEPLFTTDGDHNLGGYSNAAVDRLARRATRHGDRQERLRLWQQLETTVLEDAAVVPLFVYEHDQVVADRVRSFRLLPGGGMNLEEVWLQEAG